MVTLQDALDELRIDYADAQVTANVERSMGAAIKRMHGAIGADVETYLPGDERVDQLVLIYLRENYDAGNLTDKEISALKHLRADLEPQLRLELRAAKEEAAGGVSV